MLKPIAVLKAQQTLAQYGVPAPLARQAREQIISSAPMPTERMASLPTPSEYYNQLLSEQKIPHGRYQSDEWAKQYGELFGQAREQAFGPQYKTYTQYTLPQLMPGLYTENWLDPETNTTRPGAIAPINAYREMDFVPEIMHNPKGEIVPMGHVGYSSDYEENISNPLPYGRKPEGLPMAFFTPAHGPSIYDTAPASNRYMVGVRGLGYHPDDVVVERPGGPSKGGGETDEFVTFNPVPRSRLVPVINPVTNKYADADERKRMGLRRSRTPLEGEIKQLQYERLGLVPRDMHEDDFKMQQHDYPVSRIHPSLRFVYDAQGYPLNPDGSKMTSKQKLQMAIAAKEAGLKYSPGQELSREMGPRNPMSLVRHSGFTQGYDKLPPHLMDQVIENLRARRRRWEA